MSEAFEFSVGYSTTFEQIEDLRCKYKEVGLISYTAQCPRSSDVDVCKGGTTRLFSSFRCLCRG